MEFDPDRLMNWRVPDRVHLLTRREVAFYALSIGLGRDPADRSMLRFVDPCAPDLAALPSMALVLGYPGFWLVEPELGLDGLRILHAEQSMEILAPLPVEGKVTGRTRILDLVDRGPDKGVLVYSERLVMDEKGRVFARLLQTHMLRGIGGFGGQVAAASPRPNVSGAAVAAEYSMKVRPEQALLYRLNGDFNPIHSDPAAAAAAGFDSPILHGMCTFGIVAWSVGRALFGDHPEDLPRMSARFTGPVFPGETLRTEIREDGTFRTFAHERAATVVDHGASIAAPTRTEAEAASHAI